MRLFIAAELPSQVLDALAETSALLRGSVRGRYVASDSFHVTLAFLGDVAPAHIGDAADALVRGCDGFGPFEVALGAFGSFGKRSRATLWQGFSEAGELGELACSVREELQAEGLPFDGKAFKPHVTLMRAADLTVGSLPMPTVARGRLDTVTLFASDLSGDRPRYEPLHSACLR